MIEMDTEAKVREDVAGRLKRLLGDEDSVDRVIQKFRLIAKKVESEDLTAEATIFKAMADPCRLVILKFLREGEFCVCEIMAALDKPQSTISHHLSILKDTGLVKERRDGKWSYYRLSDGAIIEMMNQVKLLAERER